MWATFLLGITSPIVTRVLTTLGIGIVSFTGLSAVLTLVSNTIQADFNSLPADVVAIVFLSGLPQGMAIILSALSARIGMMQLSKIQRL